MDALRGHFFHAVALDEQIETDLLVQGFKKLKLYFLLEVLVIAAFLLFGIGGGGMVNPAHFGLHF